MGCPGLAGWAIAPLHTFQCGGPGSGNTDLYPACPWSLTQLPLYQSIARRFLCCSCSSSSSSSSSICLVSFVHCSACLPACLHCHLTTAIYAKLPRSFTIIVIYKPLPSHQLEFQQPNHTTTTMSSRIAPTFSKFTRSLSTSSPVARPSHLLSATSAATKSVRKPSPSVLEEDAEVCFLSHHIPLSTQPILTWFPVNPRPLNLHLPVPPHPHHPPNQPASPLPLHANLPPLGPPPRHGAPHCRLARPPRPLRHGPQL